jgi:hypothetical protein
MRLDFQSFQAVKVQMKMKENGLTRTGRCLHPTDTAQQPGMKKKKLLGVWLRHWNATYRCVHLLQEA